MQKISNVSSGFNKIHVKNIGYFLRISKTLTFIKKLDEAMLGDSLKELSSLYFST